ncbi:unnamed protein product, partial [Leptidea sinapis]
MASSVIKVEIETEVCSVCRRDGELMSPEEYDAEVPHSVPLRTMLLHINNNKVIPEGKLCSNCIRRSIDAYEFSLALSAKTTPPLSEKIRALQKRLLELTEKVDVYIVVGGQGDNPGGSYSEDDIIMVDHESLKVATQLGDQELEKARNAAGELVYQCTVCPMSFEKVSEYQTHMTEHGELARHSCWTCGAQFTSAASLRTHMSQHKAAQLTCHLCDTTFQ